MNRGKIVFGIFICLFVMILVLIFAFKTNKNPLAAITNFDQCAKAGYPVMQSYPPQCSLPNGRVYVEQLMPGR